MSKRNVILLLIVIILVITIVIVKVNRNKADTDILVQNYNPVITNTITNETTGEIQYVLYNRYKGNVITVLNESEQYKAKIYEIDPDYEELEVPLESDAVE